MGRGWAVVAGARYASTWNPRRWITTTLRLDVVDNCIAFDYISGYGNQMLLRWKDVPGRRRDAGWGDHRPVPLRVPREARRSSPQQGNAGDLCDRGASMRPGRVRMVTSARLNRCTLMCLACGHAASRDFCGSCLSLVSTGARAALRRGGGSDAVVRVLREVGAARAVSSASTGAEDRL